MKDIAGYEGLYAITEEGKVWSYKTNRFLALQNSTAGYSYVTLCKNGKETKYYVHRLVALAYLENPNNLPCVNHKDENKANNHVNNLEWCTVEYNNYYSNSKVTTWENTPKPIYCVELDIVFSSINQASKYLNIRRDRIKNCLSGYAKTVKGYHLNYIYLV